MLVKPSSQRQKPFEAFNNNNKRKSECDELGSEVNAKAALEDVGYNADLYEVLPYKRTTRKIRSLASAEVCAMSM